MAGSEGMTGYPSVDKPWLKYYSEEAINAPLPECTIFEYLQKNNQNHPDDVAIIYFSRKITYRELFENIEKTAKAFCSLGVKPGEIVTIALPSIPEALYAVYALNRLGAVANMIHPLAGKSELLNYLDEVGTRVAVLFDGTCDVLGDSLGETGVEHAVVISAAESLPIGLKVLYRLKNRGRSTVSSSRHLSWKQFVEGGRNIVPYYVSKDVDAVAIISHTGGTTGEPKGVMLSDRNTNAVICQVGAALPHRRQERMLVVLPPFVNYSLANSMLEPLALGITVVLIPDYNPGDFSAYVKKYRPNHVNSIPAYWEAAFKHGATSPSDFSCLKYLYYGGESMDSGSEETISEWLLEQGSQNPLNKGFGETELVSSATLTFAENNLPGSVGIPLPMINVKIVEPGTFGEHGFGEVGEICFSGPTLMLGYYGNEAATNEVVKVHEDGQRWLHTGDLGYVNEDGVVFLTGRIKRIVMTKGRDGQVTKIFPDRIEKVVATHPAVRVCCAIGVPDEERVNFPKAVVELNDGRTPSPELATEIIGSCRDALPEYMVPEEVEFTESLPRTERGKVDYRAVEEMIKGGQNEE